MFCVCKCFSTSGLVRTEKRVLSKLGPVPSISSNMKRFLFLPGLFICAHPRSPWMHEGFSLAVPSRGSSLLRGAGFYCGGISCRRAWAPAQKRFSSCGPTAGAVFLDQGSNLCLLQWQGHSLPLDHQGTPQNAFLVKVSIIKSIA